MAKASEPKMAPKRRRFALDKTLPEWLFGKAAPETVAAPLSPSRVGGGGEGDRQRVREGRLAHALLEMLPGVAPQRRAGAASAYLDRAGGGLAESARAALVAKVLAAIGAPELEPLFGPDSRGEVPLIGASAAARAPGSALWRPSRPAGRER